MLVITLLNITGYHDEYVGRGITLAHHTGSQTSR